MPYSLRIDDPIVDKLNEHYGGTSWMERLEPFLVLLPRDKYLVYGSRGSMGRERIGNHRTRDFLGNIWITDTKGAEHLEKPVLVEPSLAGYTFPTPELSEEKRQELTEPTTGFIREEGRCPRAPSIYERYFRRKISTDGVARFSVPTATERPTIP